MPDCRPRGGWASDVLPPVARVLGRIAAGSLVASVCLPAALHAQSEPLPGDPPASVSMRVGPLALAPALTLTSLGWDSNVFHQESHADPVGDFTSTVRPDVRAWVRLGRARVQGRSTFDFVYFHEHATERSIDRSHQLRVDVPLNRLTPYLSVRQERTKQRFGLEIDNRTRRDVEGAVAGVDIRLGSQTALDVAVRHTRVEFPLESTGASDPLVSNFYDHASTGASVALRRELTPLTTASIRIERHRDEFDDRAWRNSDSFRIASGIEFKPFALISGRAHVGWRQVNFREAGAVPFRGLVASADLAYTLLGATRLAVQTERDLSYSALQGRHAYVLSGVRGLVGHRVSDRWDVGGRVGRTWVSYRRFQLSGELPVADVSASSSEHREVVREYGGEVGYRLGSDMRIGFEVIRSDRWSTIGLARYYERTRASLSLDVQF